MSNSLTLDLITFDPGGDFTSAMEFAERVISTVERSWESGADLVLLPEFMWLGMSPHLAVAPSEPLRNVAEYFWKELLPILQERFSAPGKAVVLGTVPFILPDSQIHNRAVIFADGQMFHQDKLHLTPWENAFSPGEELRLWQFGSFLIAVIICLDIEIPELSARLRDSAVDLILCPCATETILGVERVNRCASARSVELGCYVGVSHLTGHSTYELIDENVGRTALYRPSQAAFRREPRSVETEIVSCGSQTMRVILDRHPLEVMRRMKSETNPSMLGQKIAGIERLIHIKSPTSH
jgi:predicted amidohydrolase